MVRPSRQPLASINDNEFRSVKKEKLTHDSEPESPKRLRSNRTGTSWDGDDVPVQGSVERRILRSQYLLVKNIINEEKEELSRGDSERLQGLIEKVDVLYQHVRKPREQVADAETLLEIANTLVAKVRCFSGDGLTPSDFVNSLIHECGNVARNSIDNGLVSINWKDVGILVAPAFKKANGCSTMIGPMDTELKQRRIAARRRRGRPTMHPAKPEQLDGIGEEKTDTDKNMAVMFNILRRKKPVRLEHLIVNRRSFAQTVENLFALSFLVKDGRAQIKIDKGVHLVSPKNAPASEQVVSGEVFYHHFVFRFDFKDWKLIINVVPEGEELMPHRYQASIPVSYAYDLPGISPFTIPVSPIKKESVVVP